MAKRRNQEDGGMMKEEILLTDEEIKTAWLFLDGKAKDQSSYVVLEYDRAIAKAAQIKLLAWLEAKLVPAIYTHNVENAKEILAWALPDVDLQALKELLK